MTVTGSPVQAASNGTVFVDPTTAPTGAWTLRGLKSNEGYVERAERAALQNVRAPFGRPEAHRPCAPCIRKSPS